VRCKIAVIGEGDVAAGAALRLRERGTVQVTSSPDAAGVAGDAVVVVCDPASELPAIGRDLARRAPSAVVVVASAGAEAACLTLLDATAFPRSRVLGLGGTAATIRVRDALAVALGVALHDVTALVLGGEEAGLVPVRAATTVAGVPASIAAASTDPTGRLRDAAAEEEIAAVVARELATAPARAARALAAADIAEAVALDRGRVLTCSLLLRGELGLRDVVAGVPAVVAGRGVERVLEVPLADDERAALARAAIG
jgi:malate dehydrogenase